MRTYLVLYIRKGYRECGPGICKVYIPTLRTKRKQGYNMERVGTETVGTHFVIILSPLTDKLVTLCHTYYTYVHMYEKVQAIEAGK